MSSDLARRVATKLDLAAIPEFDARGDGSLIGDLSSTSIGLKADTAWATVRRRRVLKHFYENLDIYQLEGSRVIAVDYAAQNPGTVRPRSPTPSWTNIFRAVERQARNDRTCIRSA